MLTLTTLGGVDLREGDRELRDVLRQPKRLALLIHLALAVPRERYARRDSLLALFWPELDQEHARAALRRALYFLRQAVGDGIIEARGDEELRIAPGTLACDALELAAALDAGDTARAAALYRGDFLPAFFVAGAPDVEDWIDAERERLRRLMSRVPTQTTRDSRLPGAQASGLTVLAILPFDAGGVLEYLRQGMVDLLDAAMANVPGWRVLDTRALLAAPDAEAHARAAGATHLLRGAVTAETGGLKLSVRLEAAGGGKPTLAETVGADENALFDMVDDVVRRLLGTQRGMATIAARTTTSLAALKAWLVGEHGFRLARYRDAASLFEQATRADGTFALAHYRLASSRAALADHEGALGASRLAMEHRDRLARDAMHLVEAQHAWLRGDPAEAERRYEDATASRPDDVESWYLLGDLHFHANPYRGRSIREARPFLERALALDGAHLGALAKLARLEALEQRDEQLQALVARYLELSPEADQALAMRALRAWKLGRATEKISLMAALRHARRLEVAIAFGDVALYTGAGNELEKVGRAMLTAVRSAELRALCRVMLAHIMLARGGHEQAEVELKVAREDDNAWVLGIQGLLAAMPFWDWSEAFIAKTTRDLQLFDVPRAPMHASEPLTQHNGLHGHITVYALGLLAARRDDAAAVAAYAEELAELPVPDTAEALVERMERTLGALARRLRGDAAGALALLEGARRDVWYQRAVGSPVFAGTYDRLLRAQLLADTGRIEEALGWLGAIGERTPWELPFIGPAKELRQRISG